MLPPSVSTKCQCTRIHTHNIHHLLPGCSLHRTDNVTWRSSTKFQFARMHSHKITIILSVANYIWYRTGCVATTTMLPFFKTVSNAPTENGHYPALFRLCFHRLHASHKSQCSDLALCIQTDGHCHWQFTPWKPECKLPILFFLSLSSSSFHLCNIHNLTTCLSP